MTVLQACKKLNAKIVHLSSDCAVTTGYAGDFLSFVMGRAPQGCLWFTVQSNVNVVAVATLAEVSAIVVCEGVQLEPMALQKAEQNGINVLQTSLDIYSAIVALNA